MPEARAGTPRSVLKYGLLVGALALAFFAARAAGWAKTRQREAEVQGQVVTEIANLEATAYYDYQLRLDGDEETLGEPDDYPGNQWLLNLVGKDWLHRVFYVNFSQFQSDRVGGQLPVARSDVTDTQLERLAQLPGLRWVALNGAAISDQGVGRIATLPQLERLWLTQTPVTDRALTQLQQANELTHLFLDGTRVSDAGLANLTNLNSLRVLNLSNPQLTDAGIAHLQQMPQLTSLYLDATQITDFGVRYLRSLESLETLTLRGSRIGDAGIDQIRPLVSLKELMLDGTGLTDAGMVSCGNLSGLERFSMQGTRVTNAGLQHLGPAISLKTIGLAGTACTLSGVIELVAGLQSRTLAEALETVATVQRDEDGNVVSLDLSAVRVTDEGVGRLRELQHLQWLSLYGSEVTDTGLEYIAELPALTMLNLTKTKVTDAALESLGGMSQLRTIHLTDTAVTEAGVKRLREKTAGALRIYTKEYSPFSSTVGPTSRS